MNCTFFRALALLVLAVAAPAAVAQTTGLGSAELDNFIARKMEQIHTPGLAVAVVKHGRVIWSKGFGYADIEGQIPATPDTPFYLASISKTFTASAVMQLWEDGLIDLDDDVSDYLPWPIRNPKFPEVPITFRMLLAHDSSIHTRNDVIPIEFGGDSPVSLHDWLESYLVPGGDLYDPDLNFLDSPPGAEFEYCNVGYGLLGYLVERISGQPFDEYCQDHLFAPLGMVNSSWRVADFPDFSIAPAIPYLYSHTTQDYFSFGYSGIRNYPATTLNTSANELAKWLIAHMNGGGPILTPVSTALMQTKVHQAPLGGGWNYGYGLGFEVSDWGPTGHYATIGHTGQFYGAQTGMAYRADKDVGVVILANGVSGLILPSGPRVIHGWELAEWDFLFSRLCDEGIAVP